MIWGVVFCGALIGAVITAAIWLHHLFEGEWLPHDLWRELRLGRVTLAALDAAWVKAPKSELVVTLTTTPSRIHLLEPVIKALLDQTRAPKAIEINVPHHSQRENRPYEIPPFLTGLNAVHVHRTQDLGPATKLIPTLSRHPGDRVLVVLDDDRIYPGWLIARYEEATQDHPDAALTLGGWIVPSDLTDRPTTIRSNLLMQPPAPIRAPRLRRAREIDVMLGVFSYAVRPRFFDLPEIAQLTGPPELRFVDDPRTSALCTVAKYVIPAPSLSFVPWRQRRLFQATRLGLVNRGQGQRHNTIAIQYFADRWRVGGATTHRSERK